MAQTKNNNAGRIKILSVVWYKVLPPKFGGQKAVALFNEHLAVHAPLVCICSRNNSVSSVTYDILNILPESKWQFLNPFCWRKIYRVAKKEKVTHLVLEFPYYGIAGFLCKKWLRIKWITNTHNIEFIRFREQEKWWWKLLFYFEKWALQKSDVVFFKTDADKELATKWFQLEENKLEVVPYGVETKMTVSKMDAQAIIRKKHAIGHDKKILLFAGTLDYQPNADAVLMMEKEIIPLLNELSFPFTIVVCGRNRYKEFQYLNQLQSDIMIITGEVEDIDVYFSAADVFIDPVIHGGGIQTKIMDALSFQLNVACFQSKAKDIINAEEKIVCCN